MRNRTLITLLLSLAGPVALLPSQASADNNATAEIAAAVAGQVLFNEAEKRLFGDYLEDYRYDDEGRGKAKKLPPGLRMKLERGGELPPGWQKKVARGEVLDADLYAHSHRLPDRLLRRLPKEVEGTSLRRIDDRVVRIMDATRTILDVYYLTR